MCSNSTLKFPKVSCIVIFYHRLSSELTFEKFYSLHITLSNAFRQIEGARTSQLKKKKLLSVCVCVCAYVSPVAFKFSKVRSIVIFYNRLSSELTFENYSLHMTLSIAFRQIEGARTSGSNACVRVLICRLANSNSQKSALYSFLMID